MKGDDGDIFTLEGGGVYFVAFGFLGGEVRWTRIN